MSVSPARIRSLFHTLFSLSLLFLLTACRTSKPAAPPAEPAVPLFANHHFYNSATPYTKLLVEIDSVAGTGPTQEELDELKTFLTRYCDKPDGITIKLDNVIPRSTARHRNPDSLALEYLNGPPDDQTAFLYILFDDSKLRGWFANRTKPLYTYFPYPCAIYINRAYHVLGDFYHAEWARTILLHETGHSLGLSLNPSHSQRGHCTNSNCMMRPSIAFHIGKFFTFHNPWSNTTLCDACAKDLEENKTVAPRPNERYHGKYFMRSEPGFQILTLPGFIYVHFGDASGISDAEVEEKRQKALASLKKLDETRWETSPFDPDEHLEALRLLSQEKDEIFHEIAEKIFGEWMAHIESVGAADPAKARAIISDQVIAAAIEFPELQAKFKALREKLTP